MKYIINDWKMEIDNSGQVKYLSYQDQELLHDGKTHWFKTFPIIWPQTGDSTGFTHLNKNYQVPRHGFWKDLSWDIVKENETISLFANFFANNIYPFSFDIHYQIIPLNNKIKFQVTFTNISKQNAYFQFGFHPAFKTESLSKIVIDQEPKLVLKNGTFSNEKINTNVLSYLKFGKNFDTLFYQNTKNKKISLVNNSYTLHFSYNTKHLQVWRPEKANFVCIEPWNNLNDKMYQAPNEVSKKQEITSLKPFENKIFWMEIEYLN